MIKFFSNLKNVFSRPSPKPKAKKVSLSAKKPVKKPASSAPRSAPRPKNGSKNRVVFHRQHSPAPVAKPAPISVKPAPNKTQHDSSVLRQQQQQQQQLQQQQRQQQQLIAQRLSALNEKEKFLIQKEKNLDRQNQEVQEKLTKTDELYKKQLEKLENISNLSLAQAKKLVISSTEKKLTTWIAQKIAEAKDAIAEKEEELTKEIIADSIRHGVTDYVAEYTVSTITLPDEKIKGKIIGREGRNIRAFEKATGVELELDEGNDIRISSFDSTRREIAKISLQKLIKDGRIQPVKIETIVAQTKTEMDRILVNEGRKISQEVGIFNLPVELLKHVGQYKFRFSYGQNLAKHTIEVTKIAVALAQELHANVKTVRLAGLFHDIGKVISDQEGTHVDLGVSLLQQFKVPQEIIDCVAQHHEDQPFSSVESVIVHIGDAASGTRPGARYEVHEEYLKRMKNIEEVAKSFPGVLSVAAYQAGREVMVIVDPGQVSDDQAVVLSHNISEKLEEEAKWAGQIKVTVVRELRTSSVVVGRKINNNAVKTTT